MVIAVDIMTFSDSVNEIDNMLKVLMRSLSVASGQLKAEKIAMADLLIIPDLKGIPYMSGAKNRDAFDSGYQTTIRMMPQILEMMKQRGLTPAIK
jgi:predicted acylesterase/phospholipase RssA